MKKAKKSMTWGGIQLIFSVGLALMMIQGCGGGGGGGGGDDGNSSSGPTPPPASPSAAGLRAVRTGGAGDSTWMTFDVDVVAIGSSGVIVTNLSSSAFAVPPDQKLSGDTLTFTLTNVAVMNGSPSGPYSAHLVIDQTASLAATDPYNSRIEGAKTFCGGLGSGDEVLLSAFADSGQLPAPIAQYGNWTADGPSYDSTLDSLKTLIGGETPLYDAIIKTSQATQISAHNFQKAEIGRAHV